jgi:hypothetical protein
MFVEGALWEASTTTLSREPSFASLNYDSTHWKQPSSHVGTLYKTGELTGALFPPLLPFVF